MPFSQIFRSYSSSFTLNAKKSVESTNFIHSRVKTKKKLFNILSSLELTVLIASTNIVDVRNHPNDAIRMQRTGFMSVRISVFWSRNR